jgi:hypothetical protein
VVGVGVVVVLIAAIVAMVVIVMVDEVLWLYGGDSGGR